MRKLLTIIGGILLVWGAACLFLYFAMTSAAGAEPGAPAGYHQHDPSWEGIWISQNFARCCGKEDCALVPDGGVTRLENGDFLVKETGEVFKYNAPQIEPSMDGRFWRCKYTRGVREGQTRCLFVPPLGF